MLCDAKQRGFDHIASWNRDGTGFRIHSPASFEKTIMPEYFPGQSCRKSFNRQCHLYGFERVNSGPDKGLRQHPYFLRSDRKLCIGMMPVKSYRNTKKMANIHDKGSTEVPCTTTIPLPGPTRNVSITEYIDSMEEQQGETFTFEGIPFHPVDVSIKVTSSELIEASFPDLASGHFQEKIPPVQTPSSDDRRPEYRRVDDLIEGFFRRQSQIEAPRPA